MDEARAPSAPRVRGLECVGDLNGERQRLLDRQRAARERLPRSLGSVHDKCMAVKTITIDLAAYEALARRKHPGQSFSDVIKAQFAAGSTGRDLLEAVRQFGLDEETLDAIEEQVHARRRARARAPRL